MQTLNQAWEEESHLLEKGKVFCERRNPFRTGFRVSLFTGCQANKVKTNFTATITIKISNFVINHNHKNQDCLFTDTE